MQLSSTKKSNSCFRKARVISPLHTGGPFAISHDGRRIVTCVQEDINLTDVETGTLCSFQSDATSPTALCLSRTSKNLAIFTSSNSLRIYQIPSEFQSTPQVLQPARHIPRAHDAHVHVCTTDSSSSFLASGSADGTVKVWDLHRGFVTHLFRGHGGVVSALYFHNRNAQDVNDLDMLTLFTASIDNQIRMFTLSSSRKNPAKPDCVFEGHASVPRGIGVSDDGQWLVTSGRDSVILVWSLSNADKERLAHPVKTIPTHERIESLGILSKHPKSSKNSLHVFTAGEHGVIKLWDVWKENVFTRMSVHALHTDEQKEITQAQYLPEISSIVSVHADHNFVFYSLSTGGPIRQLVGFNDEITDGLFVSNSETHNDTHFAIVTNSSLIRIYDLNTFNVQLLPGHSNLILSLDKSKGGQVFASGSKDTTARIWAPSAPSAPSASGIVWDCVAICEGHAESVGAVAMSRTTSRIRFLFTGSQDRTIKMWDVSNVPIVCPTPEKHQTPIRAPSLFTHRAHDKDINSLDISPNDKLLASGSQDRTAKIYEIDYTASPGKISGKIRLLGVCKGHKRGVWNVRFSNTERILATGSGDRSIKLWSTDNFTCLKTFEGHTNSVLRLGFIQEGRVLSSAGSDGLVKLWDVQQGECIDSLDNHEDKIWTLAVSADEKTLVSAGADSIVTFWEDCTEVVNAEKEKEREDAVLREQDFTNYLSIQDYRNAILLALAMDYPGRLLSLFNTVHGSSFPEEKESSTLTGQYAVDQALKTLPTEALSKLLTHIKSWNASARTSGIAQIVLHAILKLRPVDDIASACRTPQDKEPSSEPGDFLTAIIPYTERHLARMEKLIQESWIVDLMLREMDSGLYEASNGIVEAMDVS